MIQTMQEGFTDAIVTIKDSSVKMILDLSQHVAAIAQFLDQKIDRLHGHSTPDSAVPLLGGDAP